MLTRPVVKVITVRQSYAPCQHVTGPCHNTPPKFWDDPAGAAGET